MMLVAMFSGLKNSTIAFRTHPVYRACLPNAILHS